MTLTIFDIKIIVKLDNMTYWREFEDKSRDKKKARPQNTTWQISLKR